MEDEPVPEARQLVEVLEKRAEVPDGEWEGFSGYAVIGLPVSCSASSFPVASQIKIRPS